MRKKGNSEKDNIKIVLIAIVIITLGIIIFNKAGITGFVVISKETEFTDKLNLVVNESKNITWNVRNPGNIQSIKATGALSRDGQAKVYIQKDDKKLLIFDSTKTLFDVNVEVLPDYKSIFQGEELLIQIILFNLRGFGTVDVNVKYSIKDPNGFLIATEEETIPVETQAKFVRKLLIPSDLRAGTYVAFVEVKAPDGLVGTSSDVFTVTTRYEEEYPPELRTYIIISVSAFISVIVFIFLIFMLRKLRRKRRVKELKRKIPIEKVENLERQLKALDKAYKSKFISKASYEKNKERVENRLKDLKKK